MFYIDDIKISPNPIEVKGQLDIEVALHEESAGAKRYPGRYGYRYAQVDKRRSIYASGKNITVNYEKPYTLYEDIIFGKSVQNGVPSPDNPVEIVSIKDNITQKFTDTKSQTQTLTIPLLDELRGIKVSTGGNYTDETGQQWICDSIELKTDGIGKVIQILEYIDAKNLNWAINKVWTDMSENYAFFFVNPNDRGLFGGVMSNKLETITHTNRPQDVNKDSIMISNSNDLGVIYINIRKDRLESVDAVGLNKYLSSSEIMILRPKKTPIITPLSDEIVQKFKQIKMYQPITNIYTLENAEQKITCLAER